ncbi:MULTISPECIES: SH3 domain-containing protein [unclassified Streptomyces]|uniref:SH3 domain-containing protein n=1 Tax=unclassified Streptomyces TaxID=2593676 RepID=UPI0011CDFFCE|nr:SH3 domain-containing protein [Streptomyces sp. me109]TXS66454.1 SH3 domain-containing protein [Streptomyces sp. me109]
MATEDIEIIGGAEAQSASAAALKTYPIAPGTSVNVRSGPGTHYPIVRTLPAGSSVPIYCQCPGETVSGYYGTSNIWDNIANGQFVSDAYVKTGSDGYVAARCA